VTHRLVLALRIWLVVLLAVLLPVRGAMAAAMLCPPGGMGSELRMVQPDHAHAEHAMASADAHHAHEHSGHHVQHDPSAGDSHDEHEPASPDKCNMCAAFCSMTPMPASSAGVPERLDHASASFPELHAPAPTFLSDGQERPPRSI
jgi:hypothetical protein